MKVTNKSVKQGCVNIVSAGYCELYYLLGREPIAYTTGVYGWNYDVFNVNGVTVCTGYRGMPGPHAPRTGEFNSRARDIFHSDDDYQTKQNKLEHLRKEFSDACMDMLYPKGGEDE